MADPETHHEILAQISHDFETKGWSDAEKLSAAKVLRRQPHHRSPTHGRRPSHAGRSEDRGRHRALDRGLHL